MDIPFAKLQGAGNGYIAIDARDLDLDWSRIAPQLTHPHFGVGSDGLALLLHSEHAPVRMRIINSDGSESEMSGNGIRLFAKYAIDRGLLVPEDGAVTIETGGGVRTLWPTLEDGKMVSARVGMGAPTFEPARIPMQADGPFVREALELGGETLEVTCLAIGNPHAVALLEDAVEDFPLERVGPLVQNHPRFPNRVNFEIVNMLGANRLRVRVFERGEGETFSSGTGSTAAMIATRKLGLCGDEVEVMLRGGTLRVGWAGEGEAFLEGPAVEVFRGTYRLPDVLQNSIG